MDGSMIGKLDDCFTRQNTDANARQFSYLKRRETEFLYFLIELGPNQTGSLTLAHVRDDLMATSQHGKLAFFLFNLQPYALELRLAPGFTYLFACHNG